jgi:hypothetical protein
MVFRYSPAEGDSDGCRGQHQDPEHGHPLQARHYTQADAGPQAQVKMLLIISVADPVSGIWCLFDPLDPGSGIKNPDHISESLETIF